MYKYRTMVPNAEQILQELMETDEDIRREYKINKNCGMIPESRRQESSFVRKA